MLKKLWIATLIILALISCTSRHDRILKTYQDAFDPRYAWDTPEGEVIWQEMLARYRQLMWGCPIPTITLEDVTANPVSGMNEEEIIRVFFLDCSHQPPTILEKEFQRYLDLYYGDGAGLHPDRTALRVQRYIAIESALGPAPFIELNSGGEAGSVGGKDDGLHSQATDR